MMKIKELREMLGLSQATLAKCCGVCQQAIAKWELGTAYPRASQLPALADALHCTIDALFGREAAS